VTDLRSFSAAAPLWRECVARTCADDPAARALREVLERLALGCHSFDGATKAGHYLAAREAAASAVVPLLVDGEPDDAVRIALAERVERQLLPNISGLLRAAERTSRRDRFRRFGGGGGGGGR